MSLAGFETATRRGGQTPDRRRAVPVSVEVAQDRLRRLVEQKKPRQSLWEAGALNLKRLRGMLRFTSLPEHWALDTALADSAATVHHQQIEGALLEYLRARLRRDLPGLLEAGWVSEKQVQELAGVTRPDHYLGWAALRAADLLGEKRQLDALADTLDGEARRSAEAFSVRCENAARFELEDPPTKICAESAAALVLSHDFVRDEDARRLYDDEMIGRHRRLIEADGTPAPAPVAIFNFDDFGAVAAGYSNYSRVAWGSGIGGKRALALIDRQRVAEEVEESGGYSITLLHELVHTVQGELVDDDDDETMGESTLKDLLLEGAAEGHARLLLRGQHIQADDGGAYGEYVGFIYGLALACPVSGGHAANVGAVVAELATCDNTRRQELATQLLFGEDTPEHRGALTAVACAYMQYTDGGPGDRGPLTSAQLIRKARDLAITVRDGGVIVFEERDIGDDDSDGVVSADGADGS